MSDVIGPPTPTEVNTYLGDHSWQLEQVTGARLAEKAAQRSMCNVPDDELPWPADLREALCRRVAHNLALRGLPLGVQSAISEVAVATTRVGGNDAEVRRLELPYRKRALA